MMPFGNMTVCRERVLHFIETFVTITIQAFLSYSCIILKAYFKLPDWVEDWENIPEEKHDDPPDVKALKVNLRGIHLFFSMNT